MTTFSDDDDVTNVLGTLGGRLPAWVVVATFRAAAHAQLVDRLSAVYPSGVPVFEGIAVDVVKYAEAKLAGADVLDAIRVNLTPEQGEAADRLRASVWATVDDGIVGYPRGSSTDGGEGGVPLPPHTASPRVSSFTQVSAFPDPYAVVREDPPGRWV